MNKQEQRIAIAEACGWDNSLSQVKLSVFVVGRTSYCLPDYLNDLNAMHEAEKVLTTSQHLEYTWELTGTVEDHDPDSMEGDWLTHTATAAQRAEAFLKTLNLWK